MDMHAKADDYEESDSGSYSDELQSALSAAFPDNAWDEDKVAAFKEAMRICSEGPMEESGEEKPPKGSLALIFGKPGKKE